MKAVHAPLDGRTFQSLRSHRLRHLCPGTIVSLSPWSSDGMKTNSTVIIEEADEEEQPRSSSTVASMDRRIRVNDDIQVTELDSDSWDNSSEDALVGEVEEHHGEINEPIERSLEHLPSLEYLESPATTKRTHSNAFNNDSTAGVSASRRRRLGISPPLSQRPLNGSSFRRSLTPPPTKGWLVSSGGSFGWGGSSGRGIKGETVPSTFRLDCGATFLAPPSA
jgi:hypothetical protein